MAVLLSETWTGSNGSVWPIANWKNEHAQFAGAVDIQSNKGRLNGGTNGSGNAYAQAQTELTFSDFDLRVDLTKQSTTSSAANGYTVGVCFRGANDSMLSSGASYRVAFEWLATSTVRLQEKATTTWADLASTTYAVASGDVVHLQIVANGSSLKVWVWKNSETAPSIWVDAPTLSATDSTLTSGSVAFTLLSGSDTTADSILFDDLSINTLTTYVTPTNGAGAGTAHFEASGGSQSLTLTATDAVTSTGTAYTPGGSGTTRLGTPPTGAGTANNATGSGSGNTNATAGFASGSGTANNATVSQAVSATASSLTKTGVANNATVTSTSGTTTASAQAATGRGDATGISYLLDENGEQILDENDQPIEDGSGLTVKVSPSATVSGSGAANTTQSAVAPHVGIATSAGVANAPGVNTSGGSATTNVNPATAASAGTGNGATTLVSPAVSAATSAGVANAPQSDVPAHAAVASATGATYDLDPQNVSRDASGSGTAFDAQVNIDSANFIAAAPIPVFASAADANVGISVYPTGITITASAGDVSTASDAAGPGQIISVRDHGHTVSVKER